MSGKTQQRAYIDDLIWHSTDGGGRDRSDRPPRCASGCRPQSDRAGGSRGDESAGDLAAERGANRLALALTPPETTGRPEWDAALAGVTEYRLNHVGIPLPEWTRGVRAPELTVVSGSKRPQPIHPEAVPQELLARNVLIERVVLQST